MFIMAIFNQLRSKLGLGKTLFVPDCTTKFKLPEIYENYKKLLQQGGIQFIELDDHICSGDVLIDSGNSAAFDELRAKNILLFKNNGISSIITNDPEALKTFKEYYDIEVFHITEVLAKNMKML